MLFLRAINPCYEGLLNQFASKQKDLSTASIDSILLDAKYMDSFIPVGPKGKSLLPPSTPRSPAVATVITDRDGKAHRSPWEWLSTFEHGGTVARWRCSLRGNFYCSICHSTDNHLSTKCPMLTELGLKLIEVGGGLYRWIQSWRWSYPGGRCRRYPWGQSSRGDVPGAPFP